VAYETSKWRQQLHTVVFEADTRAGRAFDVALIIWIVTSVVVVVLESIPAIGQRWRRELFVVEISFTLLFTIEYIARLVAVKRPLSYARSFLGVIDLLAIAPTWLSLIFPGAQMFLTVRVIRLLRIFRILKLTEYLTEAGIITGALRASRR
jgi:voltage-gated potassium channel